MFSRRKGGVRVSWDDNLTSLCLPCTGMPVARYILYRAHCHRLPRLAISKTNAGTSVGRVVELDAASSEAPRSKRQYWVGGGWNLTMCPARATLFKFDASLLVLGTASLV
jgi:hypothetical protein